MAVSSAALSAGTIRRTRGEIAARCILFVPPEAGEAGWRWSIASERGGEIGDERWRRWNAQVVKGIERVPEAAPACARECRDLRASSSLKRSASDSR
jgi:hypothetical protein